MRPQNEGVQTPNREETASVFPFLDPGQAVTHHVCQEYFAFKLNTRSRLDISPAIETQDAEQTDEQPIRKKYQALEILTEDGSLSAYQPCAQHGQRCAALADSAKAPTHSLRPAETTMSMVSVIYKQDKQLDYVCIVKRPDFILHSDAATIINDRHTESRNVHTPPFW